MLALALGYGGPIRSLLANAVVFVVALAPCLVLNVNAAMCTDEPNPYMRATGKSCDTWSKIRQCANNKCENSWYWRHNHFCAASCLRAGCGYTNLVCSDPGAYTPNPTAPTPTPTAIPLGECSDLDAQPIFAGAHFQDCDGTCDMLTATNVCTFMGMGKHPDQPERQPKDSSRTSASVFWYNGICADYANYPGIHFLERTFRGVSMCRITFANPVEDPTWGNIKCVCVELDPTVQPTPTPTVVVPTPEPTLCDLVGVEPNFEGAFFSDCDGVCDDLTATNVCLFMGMNKDDAQADRQLRDSNRKSIYSVWRPGKCTNYPITSAIVGLSEKTVADITLCRLHYSASREEPIWGPMNCNCPTPIPTAVPTLQPTAPTPAPGIVRLGWGSNSYVEMMGEVTCDGSRQQIYYATGVPNDRLERITALQQGCSVTVFTNSGDCLNPNALQETYTSDTNSVMDSVSGITISCADPTTVPTLAPTGAPTGPTLTPSSAPTPVPGIVTLHFGESSTSVVYNEIRCDANVRNNQIYWDTGVTNDRLNGISNLAAGCEVEVFASSTECNIPGATASAKYYADTFNVMPYVSGITILCPTPTPTVVPTLLPTALPTVIPTMIPPVQLAVTEIDAHISVSNASAFNATEYALQVAAAANVSADQVQVVEMNYNVVTTITVGDDNDNGTALTEDEIRLAIANANNIPISWVQLSAGRRMRRASLRATRRLGTTWTVIINAPDADSADSISGTIGNSSAISENLPANSTSSLTTGSTTTEIEVVTDVISGDTTPIVVNDTALSDNVNNMDGVTGTNVDEITETIEDFPAPTAAPTTRPTAVPTVVPSRAPTAEPTLQPTLAPTNTTATKSNNDRIVTIGWLDDDGNEMTVDVMEEIECNGTLQQITEDIGVPNDRMSKIDNLKTGCSITLYKSSKYCPHGHQVTHIEDTDLVEEGVSGITVSCPGIADDQQKVILGWPGGSLPVFEELECDGSQQQIVTDLKIPNDHLSSITGLAPGCNVTVYNRSSECLEGGADQGVTYTSDVAQLPYGASGISIQCNQTVSLPNSANPIATFVGTGGTERDALTTFSCALGSSVLPEENGDHTLDEILDLQPGCIVTYYPSELDCIDNTNMVTITEMTGIGLTGLSSYSFVVTCRALRSGTQTTLTGDEGDIRRLNRKMKRL